MFRWSACSWREECPTRNNQVKHLRALDSVPKRQSEFIEPMDCLPVATLPVGAEWTFEVKFDGYRAIGVRGRETILYSRNGKNFNKRFPQITEALRNLPADTVIDGEVVALDESGRPDFHRLQHFIAEASRSHSLLVCDFRSRVLPT
jgi:ATP-dependent DNA ligase